MTEEDWQTRCGFDWFAVRPLYHRVSVRQMVLVSVAWLRRFDRYWAPLPAESEVVAAVFGNSQMRESLDKLDLWADVGPRGRTEELADAARDANEAARFARSLRDDFVEDNDDRLMEARAGVADAVADAATFVCDLAAWLGDPQGALADGFATLGDRSAPRLPPFLLAHEAGRRPRYSTPQQRLVDALADLLRGASVEVAESIGRGVSSTTNLIYNTEQAEESQLVGDIFGNPFRPVAFLPEWRTPTVVGLAAAMYAARDFAALPMLADALEEAGCDSPDIFAHCRGSGPHVRGCWVVDLVLGKS